ncbi:hypothetical protein FB451DRAFT_82502 [Mycena latifolia]|nr:hypothetical protein FB451DRAFT_82502 [Mycena latifolia]
MASIDQAPYSYTSLISSEYLPDPAERANLHILLRSNCPPPPATDYRLQVAPSLAKIAEYDVEIAKLQELMDRMVADRAILQYHAEGCLSVYAPIRHLPDEILLEIFEYCSPMELSRYRDLWPSHNVDGSASRIAQRHLRQLSGVCRSWRDIVMSSPSLWSTIDMDLIPFHPVRRLGEHIKENRMRLLNSSLDLSAVAPLHIYIRSHPLTLSHHESGAARAISHLVQSSSRWQDATISLMDPDFRCLAPAKGNLPLLKSLHICGTMPDEFDVFDTAPRLTELNLEESFPPHPKLPWRQLHTIRFTRLFPMDLPEVLSQLSCCTKMTNLTFHKLHIQEEPELPHLPSFVFDIRTFTIVFFVDTDLSLESPVADAIIGSITLPRGTSLHFKSCDTPLAWPQKSFLEFSVRSACHDTLISLEIFNMLISAADLLQCLAGLPRLEVLIVSDPIYWPNAHSEPAMYLVNDELFRGLTWTSDAGVLVPRLHAFDCETFMRFEHQIYLDFIISRLEAGCNDLGPFQTSLFRSHGGYVDPILVERLSELVRRKELNLRLEHDYIGYRWPMDRCSA